MEWAVRPAFQDVCAGLVELRVKLAEGIVYGGGTEHADALALALLQLKPLRLDNDAKTLDKEDTAENRQHQLFVNDNGTHTDDTTDSQRTCVTHKHLGRESIVPEETDHRPDESREEHHQFL